MSKGLSRVEMTMAGGKKEGQRDGEVPVNPRDDENSAKNQTVANDEADLGNALRKAYQDTVEEEIPSEMLDLLKRLS